MIIFGVAKGADDKLDGGEGNDHLYGDKVTITSTAARATITSTAVRATTAFTAARVLMC